MAGWATVSSAWTPRLCSKAQVDRGRPHRLRGQKSSGAPSPAHRPSVLGSTHPHRLTSTLSKGLAQRLHVPAVTVTNSEAKGTEGAPSPTRWPKLEGAPSSGEDVLSLRPRSSRCPPVLRGGGALTLSDHPQDGWGSVQRRGFVSWWATCGCVDDLAHDESWKARRPGVF